MDNLSILQQTIEQHIDPNGAAGSILALNHQNILKEVLSKVGKWTGSPFAAKKNPTTFPSGTFSWTGNALNNTNDFTVKVSKKTADLNDVGLILETMVLGDVIQFKDFVGRSVFLTYKSHVAETDASNNPIYTITVAGSVDNPNYIYQDAETQIAVLSYHKKLVNATPAISTDPGNIATIGTDGKIYVSPQSGTTSVENRFTDINDLTTNQGNQTDKSIQYVGDASGDPTVDSGFAYYEYLGTTNGDLTDYRKLSEAESMDVIQGSGAPPTQNTYNDLTALFGGQADQDSNYYQFVTDATDDSTVNSGWAVYQYKGTTVGDLTDYIKIMEAESMDQTPGGVSNSTDEIKKLDIFSATAENANAPLVLPSYDGTNQGTHPSVVFFETPWNGFNYWMAYTPYPNGNDDFENPCILASNDRENWVVPTGLTNPIEPEPSDGTYFADTHLIYDESNDRLICYWRGFATGLTEFYVLAKTSSDGVNWGAKTTVCTLTNGGGSPVILKNGNNFELYSIDFLTGTPHTINKIVSSNPLSFDYANTQELTYEGIPDGFEIWHFDIYNFKGVFYCVMTVCLEGTNGNGCDIIFGIVENDHFKFVDYPFLEREPGWTNQRLYRASILPLEINDDGINWAMWYGATNNSNSWNIGYTELATYYSDSYPEILPKNVKKDITLHEFFNKKTIVVQGDISVTVPQNLSKFFNLKYDVLLNSNLNFAPDGIGFSGYVPAVGNQYGELYKLNKNTVRFLNYGTQSSGGGSTVPTGSVSDVINESNALPNPPNPTGIYMSPDGSKLFLSDLGNGANFDDRFLQYELTTPFDASTMNLTPVKEYPLGPVVSMSILSVWMNDDGTELLGGFGSPEPNGILRYNLSTGFDLDTISFESSTEFLIPANPRGIQFGENGNKLFLSAMDSNAISQFRLTLPYDLSTAELDQQFISSATNAAMPAIYMSNDGKTLCALDFNNKVLRLIRLDTPYNLTTAIAEQTIALGSGGYSGMFINSDENVLMLLNYTTKKIEKRDLNLNIV